MATDDGKLNETYRLKRDLLKEKQAVLSPSIDINGMEVPIFVSEAIKFTEFGKTGSKSFIQFMGASPGGYRPAERFKAANQTVYEPSKDQELRKAADAYKKLLEEEAK